MRVRFTWKVRFGETPLMVHLRLMISCVHAVPIRTLKVTLVSVWMAIMIMLLMIMVMTTIMLIVKVIVMVMATQTI
jgi:hypothetical protein